jgi:flagellar biosynthesis/type III secretory pathway protein FliH
MKLTIDTYEELNAEQLYGLYVAAKKKEEQSKKSKETFNCGYNAGYAKCKLDYKSNHWSVFDAGKEAGYKEGYEKARREFIDYLKGL